MVRADRTYDVVVTTAAGYPLDTTYYQAVKGVVGALGVLSQGGVVILASECSGGLGSDGFRRGLERLRELGDCGDFLRHISGPANFVTMCVLESDPPRWMLASVNVASLARVARRRRNSLACTSHRCSRT